MKKLALILFSVFTLNVNSQQVKYYLTSSAGQPWGSVTNISAMNTAFGVGNWIQSTFQGVNVNALFQPSVCLIYCDGGSMNANAMNAFVTANMTAMQNWVAAGGRLFLNAAPNQGGNQNWGFGGVTLNYAVGPYSAPGYAATSPAHAIYNNVCGNAVVTQTMHNGNWYCHGYITGPGITTIINNTVTLWSGPQPPAPKTILASKPWGAGMCLFGSMTNTSWHTPNPSALNLRANMLCWLAVCCVQPTITAVANPTAICSGQTSTLTGGGAGIGGTYTWQPGGQTGAVVAVSPTATTIYTVSGTNTNNCTGTQTVQVLVNPTPVINVVANPAFACLGQSATLTLGGANTYTTNPGNLPGNVVVVSPTTTTTYSISGTSLAGCTGSTSITLNIAPVPAPTPSNNGPICVGQQLNLTVGAGLSYTWTGPSGYVNNTQNPSIGNAQTTNSGVYTVAVSNGSCAGTATTNAVVNALPVITATNNGPLCVNQALNLTGMGAATYTWSGPNGFASNLQNPNIASVQLIHSGVYTLLGTDMNTCTNVATTTLVVNPLPNVTTVNHTVCEGSPINHSANGAVNYSWNGPGGFVSNLQNPVIPFAGMVHNGAHVVVGTSAVGCTASAVSNVSVIPLVTPTITANTPCVGGTLNLSGFGGSSYVWAGPQGFASSSQNPNVNNVTLLNAGQYTLVTTIGICTNSAVYDATVNPLPSPTLISNSPVCEKGTLMISGSGGLSYSWVGPNNYTATGTSLALSNANAIHVGNYTATATDLNGCSNTAVIAVMVNPLPSIGTVGSTLCATRTLTMAASGGTSYTWAGPNGFSSNAVLITIPNVDVSYIGYYTITAVDANACSSSSVVHVHVNETPQINVGSNSPLCAGQNINLTANCPSANQFLWAGPNGFFSLQQNPVLENVGTDAVGIYTVTVTDNIGCQSKAMVNMLVRGLPNVTVTTNKNSGCVPVCINFGNASQSNITAVSWDFGDGSTGSGSSVNKCYDYAGHYSITATYTDVFGCTNRSSYGVDAYPIPFADFNINPSTPIINEQVEFSDASQYATIAQWTWLFNDLKANQVMLTPVVHRVFENAGAYAAVLIVTSDHGCVDTVVKQVIIGEDFGIYIPDAFSPNADGVNDVFQPKGFGITKFEMSIFDRWGERVFTTTDMNHGWDGTFPKRKVEEIKQDVYVWHIKLSNVHGKSKELTGKVNIIR